MEQSNSSNQVVQPLLNFDENLAICTIYMYTRDYSFNLKLAFSNLIKNRMRKEYFSDGTIIGTIFYPFQFQLWSNKLERIELIESFNKSLNNRNELYLDCLKAWKSNKEIINKDCVIFSDKNITDDENIVEETFKLDREIDKFEFYK